MAELIYKAFLFRPGQKGWKVITSRVAITPDHPEWPHNTSAKRTDATQYYDLGFTKADPAIKSGSGC